MRAILIAASEPASMKMMSARYPLALFHLVDRPVLQVVIEYLIEQGITEFNIVLNHLPEVIEDYFGDGQRWGVPIHYHLCKDPEHPYGVLQTLTLPEEEGAVLFGHINSLPDFPKDSLQLLSSAGPRQFMFSSLVPGNESVVPQVEDKQIPPTATWTGWAMIPVQRWSQLPRQADYTALATAINSMDPTNTMCEHLLSFDSYPALLRANVDILTNSFSPFQPTGRLNEPGVWINRNVMLHPTAKVTPPIYIGENSRIGANVQLGPDVVVGCDTILDVGSIVQHAIVMRNSYVGEGLELDGVIVDKNLLVNTRLEIETRIQEQFMISELSGTPFKGAIGRGISSLAGLVLWVITFPLFLLIYLALLIGRRGPVLQTHRYLRLPVMQDERWREMTVWSFSPTPSQQYGLAHCLLVALPALGSVIKGDLRLVGLPPRTPEDVQQLPVDWRALYLQGYAGLVTETMIRYGQTVTEDEQYAADAYYAVHANGWYDLRLWLSAFRTLIPRSR